MAKEKSEEADTIKRTRRGRPLNVSTVWEGNRADVKRPLGDHVASPSRAAYVDCSLDRRLWIPRQRRCPPPLPLKDIPAKIDPKDQNDQGSSLPTIKVYSGWCRQWGLDLFVAVRASNGD